ncbi:MAG: protein kinase [Planctomycetes bacterium]|nr:protein kinase [Planctomycetota bacterium]
MAALTPPPAGEAVHSHGQPEDVDASASEGPDGIRSSARTVLSPAEAFPTELETFPLALPLEDLENDDFLAGVRRVPYRGQPVPALGGILLIRRIGQGGMGAVYYGLHSRLRTNVAVKVLNADLILRHPELVVRFQREAQLAARIQSRHLVGVIDVNREFGLEYIVMEFVVGCSAEDALLGAFKQKRKGLPEDVVLELGIAAAQGLADAHEAGVVHRDLKPANLLIPRSPAGTELRWAEAKLADLGIAKLDGQEKGLTGTSATMGTLGYMAPEQARDARNAGKAADVFGLGATLYALLSGRPPVRGLTVNEALRNTLEAHHEPLDTEVSGLSPATAEVIERCLRKAPDERWADGAAMLLALELCLDRLVDAPPAAETAHRAERSSPEPGKAPAPATVRVLAIDDDATMRLLMKRFLEALPWPLEVIQAASAEEAQARIAEAVPEIVFTDVCLGATDGYEMIEWIRAQPGLALTPVVAVSAIPQSVGQTRCLMAGADAYLAKPFTKEALRHVMARMLSRVRPE